ncbi:MAG: TIGR03960 family B12-binding radical SAM protein [Bacillota bacterium]|nr:TIGR03960 family B12-binding radical SAM protein [Bacillota bacterium]
MTVFEKILFNVQKPSRYTGGELNSVVKNKEDISLRFAFCFPDVYEVGMSHLGMKIIYSLLNSRPDVWCERAFCPYEDMEEEMKKAGLPLYGLESRDSLSYFDILGFTLQTELSYTNILHMLRLSNIPLKSTDRNEDYPLIIAGGPCAYNPEPLYSFFDLFVLGEGEEVLLELADLVILSKREGWTKDKLLKEAAQIGGIYVPKFYEVDYNEDGTIKNRRVTQEGIPAVVQKRVVKDLNTMFYPESFIVPFGEIIHDRIMLEVFRGCIRGCRFCQAGNIYRPIREKSPEVLNEQAKKLISSSGYDEISLTSLSTSDYTKLEPLTDTLLDWCEQDMISLSLPSLRVDNFSTELMERAQKVRKTGLTFAPEAGTQRMRDIVNKNVTEEQLMHTCRIAFSGGWHTIKLYFMIGLPHETMEDVEGIASLAERVIDNYFEGIRLGEYRKGARGIKVTVSVSSFVPKPFTPFQWAAQDTMELLEEKQQELRSSIKNKHISLSWHERKISFLEAVFARGDRRLADVIETAYENGAKFDNWDEHLKFDVWMDALKIHGLSPEFYANRKRPYEEILPWSFIDIGVTEKHLRLEAERAEEVITTPDCRTNCRGCGANRLCGGFCDAKN